MDRRTFIASSAAALTPAAAGSAVEDPLVTLCAEHEQKFEEYLALDRAFISGDLSEHDFDRMADPILDRCDELTDEICSLQASSIQGLKAQHHHFIERMERDIRDSFGEKWSAIFDNMAAGFEALS